MPAMEAVWGWIAETVVWRAISAGWRKLTKRPIFYPDRVVLDRESALADKMRATERMYAIWFTGTKAIQEIEAVENVERLLLPHPESESMKFHELALGEYRDIGEEIRRNTIKAQNKGIEVRWLKEFLGYTLTIGNQKGLDSWVHIEISLPILHGSRHPSFYFTRSKHRQTVDDVIKMFNDLWEKNDFSQEPDS